jgi:hypothetical protein
MESKAQAFFLLTLGICFFGIIGNVLCGILLFQKELRTSTNGLLLGLAFSDTLLLVKSILSTFKSMGYIVLDGTEGVKILMYLWDWISESKAIAILTATFVPIYSTVCNVNVWFDYQARVGPSTSPSPFPWNAISPSVIPSRLGAGSVRSRYGEQLFGSSSSRSSSPFGATSTKLTSGTTDSTSMW